MAKLKKMDRPDGQREDYQFVTNEETRNKFKALHEVRVEEQPQPVLAISVSEVGDNGKAKRLESDDVDVIFHSHIFSEYELELEDFDMNLRAAAVMQDLVDRHERRIASRKQVRAAQEKWVNDGVDLTVEVPEHMSEKNAKEPEIKT